MNNRHGLFITGTDTDIGKTYVSRLLTDTLSATGTTTYMKPVQTGCTRSASGELHAPDYEFVMEGFAQVNGTYEQHVPYRFEPACSPHLAAAECEKTISLSRIRECFLSISSGITTTIVEGAGGILAPLSETMFMVDLIVHLALPVVVVTAARLGTLNHTFLTLRTLHQGGISIAGVVYNNCSNKADSLIYRDNLRMIRSHVHPVPFLELSYTHHNEPAIKEFCNALRKQL